MANVTPNILPLEIERPSDARSRPNSGRNEDPAKFERHLDRTREDTPPARNASEPTRETAAGTDRRAADERRDDRKTSTETPSARRRDSNDAASRADRAEPSDAPGERNVFEPDGDADLTARQTEVTEDRPASTVRQDPAKTPSTPGEPLPGGPPAALAAQLTAATTDSDVVAAAVPPIETAGAPAADPQIAAVSPLPPALTGDDGIDAAEAETSETTELPPLHSPLPPQDQSEAVANQAATDLPEQHSSLGGSADGVPVVTSADLPVAPLLPEPEAPVTEAQESSLIETATAPVDGEPVAFPAIDLDDASNELPDDIGADEAGDVATVPGPVVTEAPAGAPLTIPQAVSPAADELVATAPVTPQPSGSPPPAAEADALQAAATPAPAPVAAAADAAANEVPGPRVQQPPPGPAAPVITPGADRPAEAQPLTPAQTAPNAPQPVEPEVTAASQKPIAPAPETIARDAGTQPVVQPAPRPLSAAATADTPDGLAKPTPAAETAATPETARTVQADNRPQAPAPARPGDGLLSQVPAPSAGDDTLAPAPNQATNDSPDLKPDAGAGRTTAAAAADRPGDTARPAATPSVSPGIAATPLLDPASPIPALPAAPAGDPLTLPLAQNAHNVSIRFGTSPQLGNVQTPVNTIAFNIAKNFDAGNTRFQIRIDPPELGRVDVRLDMSVEGRAQAHLTVERSETLELMMRDARSLERALADAGLSLNKDSLTFSLKDQGGFDGEGGLTGEGGDAQDATDTPEDVDESQPQHAARGYISATGVDISV